MMDVLLYYDMIQFSIKVEWVVLSTFSLC